MEVILGIEVVIALGFFLRRRGVLDGTAGAAISRLCADVLVPAMILNSMLMELTPEILRQCGWLILGSVIMLLLAYLFGHLFIRVARPAREDGVIYRYCILFSNFGLVGLPIAEGLYGSEGVFYFTIAILAYRILFNSYGIMMMRGNRDGKGLSWRSFVNMPILALVLGIVLDLLHIGLWGPIKEFVSLLAKANAPMGLLAVGINLGDRKITDGVRNARLWATIAIRLLIMPMLALITLRFFPVNALLVEMLVLAFALPCPAMASVLAKRYDRNAALGSQLVLLSTLLSALTIPLVLYICHLVL